jgi:hypothetical protein
MLRRRRPEAVRALETLQQERRKGMGDPPVTREMVIKDLLGSLTQRALSRFSSLDEMISKVERATEQAETELAEILAQTDVADTEQWSRYEQPFARIQIAHACGSVEDVFGRRGWPMPEPPVVGTLATGQITTQVQPGAGDAVLILIENGFFNFAGVMSQLILFTTIEAAAGRESVSEPSLQLLADLVSSHAFLNSCLFMYPRSTPPELAATVDLLQHAVVVFVIAHEYAHIAAGDTRASGGEGSPPLDLRSRELAADRRAALATLEVIDAEARERGLGDSGLGIVAPFVFLAGLDILTRAEAAVADETPVMETASPADYPTCYERAQALLTLCDTDPELQPVAHLAQEASESYVRVFLLYQAMHPLVVQARRDYGLLDLKGFGMPSQPSYGAHYYIMDFWDRVRARFMGCARGDSIREQMRATVALMREGGQEVSDLEAMVENVDWVNARSAEPG